MKKIEIIIPDRYINEVNEILKEMHHGGITRYRVEGRGKVKAKPVAIDRGTRQFVPEFVPRTKIEAVVSDDQVDAIINRITGKINDPATGGKIFVVDVSLAVDLGTNARGDGAL